MVVVTVVAPSAPWATSTDRSRRASLGHCLALLAQVLDLLLGQTRLQPAAQDGNGGGHGAPFSRMIRSTCSAVSTFWG